MSEIKTPGTSGAYFESISISYSHQAFRKSLAQLLLTNLTHIFFDYEMRTRHKIEVEAGIFLDEKRNLETRKSDLKQIYLIETVKNDNVFHFYAVVFFFRSKFRLQVFFS